MAGIGYGLGFGFRKKMSAIVYDISAQAYFDAVPTPFSAIDKGYINTFFLDLKASNNNFSHIDVMYLFANSAQGNAGINLIDPATFTATEVNAPGWVAYEGYTSDVATSYLNSTYTPSTDAINFSLNSASAGIYSRTESTESTYDFGVISNAGNNRIEQISRHGDGNFYARMNDTTYNIAVNASSLALQSTLRTSSTSTSTYTRGSLLNTDAASSSVAVPTIDMYVLCFNSAGAASSFSGRQYSFFFIGDGLVNISELYTAIQTLMTSFGKQV